LSHKDLILTKGVRTASGSLAYKDFIPDEDDIVVERMRAAGGGLLATGSDGGGSVGIPASFCGLYGLKGSMGRIPLYPGARDERFPGVSGWKSPQSPARGFRLAGVYPRRAWRRSRRLQRRLGLCSGRS